jgi:hypothetical membrane protein
MERLHRHLLAAGIAVPVIYYVNLLVCSLLYPGYDHARQWVSELGSASARYPAVFNTSIAVLGVLGVASGPGFGWALRRRGAGRVVSVLVALLVAGFGVAMVMGGLFPMPDPRHNGFGLAVGLLLAPPLMAWGLRRRPELRWLRILLAVNFVVMTALFVILMGVGSLVTRANVGLWQRAFSLAMFPWLGIAAWALLPRRERAPAAPRLATAS